MTVMFLGNEFLVWSFPFLLRNLMMPITMSWCAPSILLIRSGAQLCMDLQAKYTLIGYPLFFHEHNYQTS